MADSQPTRNAAINQPQSKQWRLIDHVGDRFGMLVVLRRAPSVNKKTRWECKCDCGNRVIATATNLRTGNSTSCGCTNQNAKYKQIDLTGKRMGSLVVLSTSKLSHLKWTCLCDCGEVTDIGRSRLLAGQVSCGCKEAVKTTHGKSGTAIYRIWKHMIDRCENERDAGFYRYGGRGITVCERWKVFENFYADMGDRPRGRSIDRIDNNGNYEPSNCRWATWTEQGCNKRNNRIVSVNGRSFPLSQACREYSIDVRVAAARLRNGWSEHDALTVPNLGIGKRRIGHA